jgi:hypothetical protein
MLKAIVNRDVLDTSYHFALLRGLAELAVEFDHLARRRNNNQVTLPLGLLVLKWVLYYFPIVDQDLPQTIAEGSAANKQSQLHFQAGLKKLTAYYAGRGGYAAFYTDLTQGGIGADISRELIIVLRQIRDAIEETMLQAKPIPATKKYPLLVYNRDTRHIMEVTSPARINPEFLVQNFGTFNIRRNLYEALRNFADFLTGTGSIINRWALFSSHACASRPVAVNHALSVIATPVLNQHDTSRVRKLYEEIAGHGVDLRCVWSGRALNKTNMVIDHVIPFSLIPNNDLWNLMPCHKTINTRKGNRITDPGLLAVRSEVLVDYWAVARDFYQSLFDRQFRTSLVGFEVKNYEIKWADAGLSALKDRCRFYIEQQGMKGWNV